jgi:hypothetical protein
VDPEVKQLLKENIALAKENNQLLRKLVHSQKMATIYRVVYWGIIILSSVGAYYFIQPYLGNLLNVYTGGVSGMNNISDITKSLSNKQQMEDLFNSLKK